MSTNNNRFTKGAETREAHTADLDEVIHFPDGLHPLPPKTKKKAEVVCLYKLNHPPLSLLLVFTMNPLSPLFDFPRPNGLY